MTTIEERITYRSPSELADYEAGVAKRAADDAKRELLLARAAATSPEIAEQCRGLIAELDEKDRRIEQLAFQVISLKISLHCTDH